jgi:hypothetical protein
MVMRKGQFSKRVAGKEGVSWQEPLEISVDLLTEMFYLQPPRIYGSPLTSSIRASLNVLPILVMSIEGFTRDFRVDTAS